MIDRRTMLRDSGGVALAAFALSAVASGTPAHAQDADAYTPMPDPATTPCRIRPIPAG